MTPAIGFSPYTARHGAGTSDAGYATGVANASLSFEVNKTAELNYVYRTAGTAARATLFYSKLVDMIFVNNGPQGPQFGNFREGRADGFELEWERELTRAVKATATLSWVDAKDNRNSGPPPSFAFVTQTPPVWQIALSLVLTLAAIVMVTWAASRVYRVGILMYGKRPTFPEIVRWARMP